MVAARVVVVVAVVVGVGVIVAVVVDVPVAVDVIVPEAVGNSKSSASTVQDNAFTAAHCTSSVLLGK